ncbi:hypothetical protein POM88_013605 [Heracleum sosnowskyi]|uniref:Uncharacterized protein n=1 Tax=Heracleum sosnowskyi TaxID=360622 RepID=A0AAD8N2W4_9APIA|nr:hypothetical protein POM88_013605 [Heracleum sosnowskyi]
MSQAMSLIPRMLKLPPLKALSLFNSSTHHSPQSVSTLLHLLLSSNLLSHAQSLLLRLLSGRVEPSISSVLDHLSPSYSYSTVLYEVIINAHVKSQFWNYGQGLLR